MAGFSWEGVGIAAGVITSLVALILNWRKGKRDIESALLADYDKLRQALCDEIERLNKRVAALETDKTSLLKRVERIEAESDELRRDRDDLLHELEHRDLQVRGGATVN